MPSFEKSNYKIIVIVGLPCSGKSTIAFELQKRSITIKHIPCFTSRKKRMSDEIFKEYSFISIQDFKKENKSFYHVSKLHGNCYGTLASDVSDAVTEHLISSIICDIECSLKLFYQFGNLIKLFFIECPLSIIYRRAHSRDNGSDSLTKINNCLDWPLKVNYLIEKERIPFCRIDNSGSIDFTINQIKNCLTF